MNAPHTNAQVEVLAGDRAWFVCRHGAIVDDVTLPLQAGRATEDEIAKQWRMRAARLFKRRHGLHPCVRVDCEFQAIEREGGAR